MGNPPFPFIASLEAELGRKGSDLTFAALDAQTDCADACMRAAGFDDTGDRTPRADLTAVPRGYISTTRQLIRELIAENTPNESQNATVVTNSTYAGARADRSEVCLAESRTAMPNPAATYWSWVLQVQNDLSRLAQSDPEYAQATTIFIDCIDRLGLRQYDDEAGVNN